MKKNFAETIKNHLSEYRKNTLKLPEGTYKHQGTVHTRGHILPKDRRGENILETINSSFWKYAAQATTCGGKPLDGSLHKFFHHLNSSQAMCFNLFYPLIKEKQLALIPEFLGIKAFGDLEATFEMESKKETGGERKTNFDFHLGWPKENEIFFEVKYTEREFGEAEKDTEHREKFRSVYKNLASGASAFLTDKCQEEDFFLDHYQLLRNLVHLSDNAHVVFVYASQNKKIEQQATEAVNNFLTNDGRKRVKLVTVENLVAHFKSHKLATDYWGKHWEKFQEKYLPELRCD